MATLRNVLVIDSDRDAREGLRDVLEVEGFRAVEAASAVEARALPTSGLCVALLRAPRSKTALELVRLARHEAAFLRIAFRVLDETQATARSVPTETISISEYIRRRHEQQMEIAKTLRPIRKARLAGPVRPPLRQAGP